MAASELPGAIASPHVGGSGAYRFQHLARVPLAQAAAACQTSSGITCRPFLGAPMTAEQQEVNEPFAERHYTVNELARMREALRRVRTSTSPTRARCHRVLGNSRGADDTVCCEYLYRLRSASIGVQLRKPSWRPRLAGGSMPTGRKRRAKWCDHR